MSSIISDIFYGSKQNLLDNYLINRFDKEPSLSIPQQRTAIYSSSLQFTINIPLAKDEGQKNYQISVQMGKKIDQVIVSLGGSNQTPEIVLVLNDLDKLDLSTYSNIKITISQGKYKNKVFGYIPIQTIKSLITQQGFEKTIALPMKGKHFIGFTSIRCTIKGEFTQNNILSSNILGSVDKDNSQLSNFNSKNRQNQIENMSRIDQPSQDVIINRAPVRKSNDRRHNYGKSSQQSKHYDSNFNEKFRVGSSLSNKPKVSTQYIRQITTVTVIFSSVQLNKHKETQGLIELKHNDSILVLGQEVPFTNLTKEGLNIEVLLNQSRIGEVHLNALFLTMNDFKGQLPIYGQNQQFLGTIYVCSPSNFVPNGTSTFHKDPTLPKQNNFQQKQQLQTEPFFTRSGEYKQLMVLSIEKIIMTNTSNQLNNQSVQNVDQQKLELFDFIKMEAQNRLELIIRVNRQTYKFNDIAIRYIIDYNQIQVVQFKRRQEFIIHSFHANYDKNNTIQIELYSNHRLLCYSKSSFSHQTTANHQFLPAQTNFRFCHCGIYLKFIQLQAQEDYFHESRVKYVIDILQRVVKGEVKINDLSDEGIKKIMNLNKKIAYVEVKKLFTLIHKQFQHFIRFQQARVESVFSNELYKNEAIVKLNAKLLREFVLIDFKGESAIQNQQFTTILRFFSGEEQQQIKKEYQLLVSNCIKTNQSKVLYPLFVAGLYLLQENPSGYISEQIPSKQQIYRPQKSNEQLMNKKQVIKQVPIRLEQLCHVQKIIFSNLHLLNLGKIPNVALNIVKKVSYSNASPQFIIEKPINIMQPIKIYHKNIALNDLTLLAQLQPAKRRSLYEIDISGKATAQIVWGN